MQKSAQISDVKNWSAWLLTAVPYLVKCTFQYESMGWISTKQTTRSYAQRPFGKFSNTKYNWDRLHMVHIQIESNQYWYFYLTILAGSRPAEQSVFICSHEFFSPISRDCLTIRWWAHYQNIIKTIEVFLKTKKFCLLITLVRFYTPNEERMNWLQRSLA